MSHLFNAFKPDGTPVCSQCGETKGDLSAQAGPDGRKPPCPDAPLASGQATAAPPDDELFKKLVKFTLSARPKQIRVTDWLAGAVKSIDVYDDDTTTYDDFVESIANAFLLDERFRVYALTPPSYAWRERCEVLDSSFRDVLSNIVHAKREERYRLFMLPTETSPESSPTHLKRAENDETASVKSDASRPGQEDFKKRTRFRDDEQCVFCKFNGDPLYAAHILPYSPHKTDQEAFKRYELSGINDTCNGLTLCWNCHQAFDNDLVCISPVDSKLVVAQALQEIEAAKWKRLHGQTITSTSPHQWPRYSLLEYRANVMNLKAEQRKANREDYPYRCRQCHAGCKTVGGLLNRHAGSEKCATRRGKMASYTTPQKLPEVVDDEEIFYE